ncbi:hypothetical protein [Spirillospora sp. NPDC047279]|uniref:hypothetical protein n=1 Tax=Spirillospora sp. NPDC047279 TaxID=3155478 RepID=UPI0033D2D575
MYPYVDSGETPIPALDAFAVDDLDESEDSTVVDVAIVPEPRMIQLAAWDDGLGLDVALLLTLPNARQLCDRLARTIQLAEAGAGDADGVTP